MKALVLYEYPPLPGGLSTQGDLLYKGLREISVDAHAAHLEYDQEKEWYYRWFRPDVTIGIGYWGHTPHIVLHPQRFGIAHVPWLVADGYIANYRDVLNDLPLILVTSNWVKQTYIRDGIRPDNIEVLPVGCDTDTFIPRIAGDPKIAAVRHALGVEPDELLILTVGGDGASKGSQEVMRALAMVNDKVPKWKYVCKVWPQPRTEVQNALDMALATELGIQDKVVYVTSRMTRTMMPYLLGACDIYAGPSRLEGFGMPHVEAGACGKPVVAIQAMAFTDTIAHGQTGFLAGVAVENRITETILGEDAGFNAGHHIVFDPPRIADYRANVADIADALLALMTDAELRDKMGEAGRRRVVERFDYRVVAEKSMQIISQRLFGIWSALSLETLPAAQSGQVAATGERDLQEQALPI